MPKDSSAYRAYRTARKQEKKARREARIGEMVEKHFLDRGYEETLIRFPRALQANNNLALAALEVANSLTKLVAHEMDILQHIQEYLKNTAYNYQWHQMPDKSDFPNIISILQELSAAAHQEATDLRQGQPAWQHNEAGTPLDPKVSQAGGPFPLMTFGDIEGEAGEGYVLQMGDHGKLAWVDPVTGQMAPPKAPPTGTPSNSSAPPPAQTGTGTTAVPPAQKPSAVKLNHQSAVDQFNRERTEAIIAIQQQRMARDITNALADRPGVSDRMEEQLKAAGVRIKPSEQPPQHTPGILNVNVKGPEQPRKDPFTDLASVHTFLTVCAPRGTHTPPRQYNKAGVLDYTPHAIDYCMVCGLSIDAYNCEITTGDNWSGSMTQDYLTAHVAVLNESLSRPGMKAEVFFVAPDLMSKLLQAYPDLAAMSTPTTGATVLNPSEGATVVGGESAGAASVRYEDRPVPKTLTRTKEGWVEKPVEKETNNTKLPDGKNSQVPDIKNLLHEKVDLPRFIEFCLASGTHTVYAMEGKWPITRCASCDMHIIPRGGWGCEVQLTSPTLDGLIRYLQDQVKALTNQCSAHNYNTTYYLVGPGLGEKLTAAGAAGVLQRLWDRQEPPISSTTATIGTIPYQLSRVKLFTSPQDLTSFVTLCIPSQQHVTPISNSPVMTCSICHQPYVAATNHILGPHTTPSTRFIKEIIEDQLERLAAVPASMRQYKEYYIDQDEIVGHLVTGRLLSQTNLRWTDPSKASATAAEG